MIQRGVWADLEERVLLLGLELVGPKELETAGGLCRVETLVGALKQLEDVVDNDGLQVDFFFVVQILCLELDLSRYVSTG